MIKIPQSMLRLIDSFKKLPGVGNKTAERLAYFILDSKVEYSQEFAESLSDIYNNVKICSVCFFYYEVNEECICSTINDKSTICIVQRQKDVISFDKTGYRGLYHVLGGVLSPLDQIGPEDLNIDQLLIRLNNDVKEIIVATDTSLEGDATSIYLTEIIGQRFPYIKISKLARGIPVGGQFDYLDEMTLIKAFDDRTEI